MTDPNTPVIVVIVGLSILLFGKILWDWLKSGRLEKGEYLTIAAFENHRRECCAIKMKQDFNKCQKESSANQSRNESRLEDHDRQLGKGDKNFQLLREDIQEVNSKVDRLIGVVETSINKR